MALKFNGFRKHHYFRISIQRLYIGLPKKPLWDSVLKRLERRLSSWEGRYLSMGRRVTLIKSVLSSIPIYFLSCFKCPKGVLRRVEKIQCVWNDSVEKRKYYLVRWESVCKHLDQGGLDIRSIAKVNKPLLGKWLRRAGEHSHGSWRKIIVCMYKLGNNGW